MNLRRLAPYFFKAGMLVLVFTIAGGVIYNSGIIGAAGRRLLANRKIKSLNDRYHFLESLGLIDTFSQDLREVKPRFYEGDNYKKVSKKLLAVARKHGVAVDTPRELSTHFLFEHNLYLNFFLRREEDGPREIERVLAPVVSRHRLDDEILGRRVKANAYVLGKPRFNSIPQRIDRAAVVRAMNSEKREVVAFKDRWRDTVKKAWGTLSGIKLQDNLRRSALIKGVVDQKYRTLIDTYSLTTTRRKVRDYLLEVGAEGQLYRAFFWHRVRDGGLFANEYKRKLARDLYVFKKSRNPMALLGLYLKPLDRSFFTQLIYSKSTRKKCRRLLELAREKIKKHWPEIYQQAREANIEHVRARYKEIDREPPDDLRNAQETRAFLIKRLAEKLPVEKWNKILRGLYDEHIEGGFY